MELKKKKVVSVKFFSIFKNIMNEDEIILNLQENESTFTDLLKKIKELHGKDLFQVIFKEGTDFKPDILILKNERDYSVLSDVKKVIQDKDTFVFLSSIHGG